MQPAGTASCETLPFLNRPGATRMPRRRAQALARVMKQEEIETVFKPELRELCGSVAALIKELSSSQKPPSRSLFFALLTEVDRLEAFLDDRGARHNRSFFFFRELVACIRWIGIATFHILHLIDRFDSYAQECTRQERREFLAEMRRWAEFHHGALQRLGKSLCEEGVRLGVWPEGTTQTSVEIRDIAQRKILPADLDESVVQNQDERVIEVMMKFLETSERLVVWVCQVRRMEEVTEETLEQYRSSFNQLQSLYDSYLRSTEIETQIPDLPKVRGHISITLHLLEVGRALAHFLERHSDLVRETPLGSRISALVRGQMLRQAVQEFVLLNAVKCAERAKKVCGRVFRALKADPDEFILDTKALTVPSYRREDFHIRPIMPLTQIAAKYKVSSYLFFNRTKYNMKSPIEMAIAIPDIREALQQENAVLMVQGPRKGIEEVVRFLGKKCGAFENELVCGVLETQSARLDT